MTRRVCSQAVVSNVSSPHLVTTRALASQLPPSIASLLPSPSAPGCSIPAGIPLPCRGVPRAYVRNLQVEDLEDIIGRFVETPTSEEDHSACVGRTTH